MPTKPAIRAMAAKIIYGMLGNMSCCRRGREKSITDQVSYSDTPIDDKAMDALCYSNILSIETEADIVIVVLLKFTDPFFPIS